MCPLFNFRRCRKIYYTNLFMILYNQSGTPYLYAKVRFPFQRDIRIRKFSLWWHWHHRVKHWFNVWHCYFSGLRRVRSSSTVLLYVLYVDYLAGCQLFTFFHPVFTFFHPVFTFFHPVFLLYLNSLVPWYSYNELSFFV